MTGNFSWLTRKYFLNIWYIFQKYVGMSIGSTLPSVQWSPSWGCWARKPSAQGSGDRPGAGTPALRQAGWHARPPGLCCAGAGGAGQSSALRQRLLCRAPRLPEMPDTSAWGAVSDAMERARSAGMSVFPHQRLQVASTWNTLCLGNRGATMPLFWRARLDTFGGWGSARCAAMPSCLF